MAVSMFSGVHGISMGVKRALSESEDSEYSEDESGHCQQLTAASSLHIHLPEWTR